MSKTLQEIANQLKDADKKVQLIYAFNGSGKTRLSRAFKELVAPKKIGDQSGEEVDLPRNKILYYNAFTEDLFYWDNDLEFDSEPILKIQPNTFTDWLIAILQELGEDGNIVANFHRYTGSNANPVFNEEYRKRSKDFSGKDVEIAVPAFLEIEFQVVADGPAEPNVLPSAENESDIIVQGQYKPIKISKGEESNFIWSVMYTLLQQVVSTLNEPDVNNRITDKFNSLEYVFIDDPVSSLDDSHLIALAVDLAKLVKSSSSGLRFIITTHSPLFYNILSNEFNNKMAKDLNDEEVEWVYRPGQCQKFRLDKKADGTFSLAQLDRRNPFSYHLLLLSELREAIASGEIKKYHFNFLRNIFEKTATYLGRDNWESLLPKGVDGNPDPFANRILNLSSHSAHAGEETGQVEVKDKEKLEELVDFLSSEYGFWKQQGG